MLLKYTTSKVDIFSAHLIDIVDIKVFIITLSTVLCFASKFGNSYPISNGPITRRLCTLRKDWGSLPHKNVLNFEPLSWILS